MQEIGSDTNYRWAVDKEKNRAHLWLFGDVLTTQGVTGVVKDTKAACDALKPGFTMLADFTGLNLLALPDFAQKVQATLMDAGVKKIASVWNRDTFAKLIVDSSAQKVAGGAYDAKRRVFHSMAEAEAWLDE